jgi:glutamyl-Q tRNA(Asp) synthetase
MRRVRASLNAVMTDFADAAVTRFAPSPTGRLHLGHAYAALVAFHAARGAGGDGEGRFLVRIEDIDGGRCKPAFEDGIFEDLAWLGLTWETPVRRQSEHMDDYARALDRLDADGLLYPCFCTRADIRREIETAAAAPHLTSAVGPDGPLYPGTCRALGADERTARIAAGEAHALRLDMAAAVARTGPLTWTDADDGPQPARPDAFGDVVLARKDIPTSYHLAATLDDHIQGVTLVTRGADLRPATDVHRLLQAVLGLKTPAYQHHRIVTDAAGRRFAKRDAAVTLQALRAAGHTPEQVRALSGWPD